MFLSRVTGAGTQTGTNTLTESKASEADTEADETVKHVGVKIGVAAHLSIRDGSKAPLAETVVTLWDDRFPKPFFSYIPWLGWAVLVTKEVAASGPGTVVKEVVSKGVTRVSCWLADNCLAEEHLMFGSVKGVFQY